MWVVEFEVWRKIGLETQIALPKTFADQAAIAIEERAAVSGGSGSGIAS